jgi:hypothetical protein
MDAWDNDYPDLIKPILLPSTKAARVSSYSAPSKADLTEPAPHPLMPDRLTEKVNTFREFPIRSKVFASSFHNYSHRQQIRIAWRDIGTSLFPDH